MRGSGVERRESARAMCVGVRVGEGDWVVLAEHRLFAGWVPIDAGGLELLLFEALLGDEGIEAEFDPFRPGEGGGFTRDCDQPLRLMVRTGDLERARSLVSVARAMPESSE